MQRSSQARSPIIGVLALQGDYDSHARALQQAGAQPKMVRTVHDLEQVEGLIIPGGESTTFLNLLEREGLFLPLEQFVRTHPTFGTCAGCILLARRVTHPQQQSLGLLDATVERNAYGRQIDSEIVTGPISLPGGPLEMVFIRAPRIVELGKDTEILATREGSPVLVRQKNILAATFHPELSHPGSSMILDDSLTASEEPEEHFDRRVHRYFVQMVRDAAQAADESASAAQDLPLHTTVAERE